jgi:hypothetical protein
MTLHDAADATFVGRRPKLLGGDTCASLRERRHAVCFL